MFFYGLWPDACRPHTSKWRGLISGIQPSIVGERSASGKPERFSPGGMPPAGGLVFLNLDNGLSLSQLGLQAGVLTRQTGNLVR